MGVVPTAVLECEPAARTVALSPARIDSVYRQAKVSYPGRFTDWKARNDHLEFDRTWRMPRIRDFYSRARVTADQRCALHATRDVIQGLTSKTFMGSQGLVGEWVAVLAAIGIDPDVERRVATTPRDSSLKACIELMRANSYDISEGVRFVRTPLVLPKLEHKYYVLDLTQH